MKKSVKKNLKEFFMLNTFKVIITFVTMVVGLYSVHDPVCDKCGGIISCGFPFAFVTQIPNGDYMIFDINYFMLMINLVFWYVFACVLFFLSRKIYRMIVK
jgi:hypothetical protein